MNRKAGEFILLVIVLIVWNNLEGTGFSQAPPGRCGDGVCDAELPANVNAAAIPAAPNKARIKAEVLNITQTVYANNEVSILSLKIIDYKSIEGAWPNPGEVEAFAYHKNNDVSLLLEIENGDEIEAVLSLSGDERGKQWQIKEVKLADREASI